MPIDQTVRALIPRSVATSLTRRGFLQRMGSASAAALGLAASACRRSAAPESTLSLYTWAEYHNPQNVDAFSEKSGITVTFDIFESNEAMVAKLTLAGASSGYDIIVPTSEFLPQLIRRGLLMKLNPSQIPNLANQDPSFVSLKNRPGGDMDGQYTAIKDWGSTGFVYDTRVIREELRSWADFVRVAGQPGVSGLVSVLPSPAEVLGIVFWRDGIAPDTTDSAHLDHAERVLLSELAPHLRAFEVRANLGLAAGDYVLSQMWNGDARKAVIEQPDRLRWVLGAPKTNLWVAAWAILASAPHPEAAHEWINYMLQPAVAAKEIEFTGNDTAVVGVGEHLPADLPGRDVIFFTEEEKGRLVPSVINEAQQRQVEIYNAVKVRAGRA